FAGKTIRVVSTPEGSGLGRMVSDVQRLCAGAVVEKNGLAVRGCRAKQSKEIVARWLMTQDE
ncbi:MAG: hypothetical protein IJG83_02855, partial [Thermoguttaceae bacterium]|nr:hypothetical protein [Thermoguttaceae bacterium]